MDDNEPDEELNPDDLDPDAPNPEELDPDDPRVGRSDEVEGQEIGVPDEADEHGEEPEEDDGADEDDDEEDEERDGLESVTIEIAGLSLYTHHGVSAAEREVGQRLMLDLRLEVGETDATVTDRIEDTVDYAEVCQLVALIAQQRSHKTLERLCSTIAERLLADYELEGVWVKATKPEPPIALPVEEVSVEVWREAED
jgi:dihydroneopterin aldolase